MPQNFTTPVGRFVQGDPVKPRTTDQQGNPLTIKTGPNAGQTRSDYFMAIAVPKNSPEWPAFKAIIDSEAQASWPQGQHASPKFSNKIIDGDGVDDNGKQNSEKVGFAGCWVVRLSSGYAPTIWARSKVLPPPMQGPDPEALIQVTDPSVLKRGYFTRASGNAASNSNMQSPGLYLNYSMVELVGYGEEIHSGPTASEAFGAPAAVPPGASATPPGGAGAPAPGAPAPGAPQPTASPSPQQSYDGYMPQGQQGQGAAPPPPAGAAAPPPPAAGPALTAKAGQDHPGVTLEQFRQSGWTDDQLRQSGYLA